jgi:serine/threonine-protein kinase RsbW
MITGSPPARTTLEMTDTRYLTLPARFENIPTIALFVAEAARAAGMNEAEVFHCQMAADEACTNIVEHAYGDDEVGVVEVTVTVRPGRLTVRVVDYGEAFDPSDVPAPSFSGDVENLQPGGIGLHLMRSLMDDVRFSFGPDRNQLIMEKVASGAGDGPAAAAIPVRTPAPGIGIVSPQGRLDAVRSPELERTFADLLDGGRPWLIVDFSDVSFISSRGLKALVSAWRGAGEGGGDLALCAMSDRIRDVLDTVGFSRLFTIHRTCDDALADFRSRSA